jgi:hypothetical protein
MRTRVLALDFGRFGCSCAGARALLDRAVKGYWPPLGLVWFMLWVADASCNTDL